MPERQIKKAVEEAGLFDKMFDYVRKLGKARGQASGKMPVNPPTYRKDAKKRAQKLYKEKWGM